MAMRFKLQDSVKAKKYFETKLAFTTGPAELKYIMDQGEPPQIIDVRKAEDYEKGHIPGAINLPEEEWENYKNALSKKKANVVYCYSLVCHLAARAAAFFAKKEYPVVELEGGIEEWQNYGYPLDTGSSMESHLDERLEKKTA